jgi:GMP synthase (glutamine-hydrolysing)
VDEIKEKAAGRKIFFLVSGGVDSSVAFTLCAKALGGKRVVGLYVDTGMMRKQDRADVERLISNSDATIHILDAHNEFIDLLKNIYNPEEKRRRIGQKFVEIHERTLSELLGGVRDDWMLGQGTIYPDTIESGGTKLSSKIKTHHNRVEIIQNLIREGKVVEPLSEFYKDEVREIGHALGMDRSIVDKHPFPGPGLAVRCLASRTPGRLEEDPDVSVLASAYGLCGARLKLKTVGVKGDERCYQDVAILAGKAGIVDLAAVSNQITNDCTAISRVVYLLTRNDLDFHDWRVVTRDVNAGRLELLRSADDLVHRMILDYDHRVVERIWQFPVVLIPLVHSETGAESVVLRPVESTDGMTASFSRLPLDLLSRIAKELHHTLKVEVLYDITNKPPATIEWE